MDGIFINLTGEDIDITDINGKQVTIKCDPELITPRRYEKQESSVIKTETEFDKIIVKIETVVQYIKYPFTEEQILKINKISSGKTRLFILNEDDANYWSNDKFECPFRNYRLFVIKDQKILEYPRPRTYLDLVVDSANSILRDAGKKIYGIMPKDN
jgi:hypothetical protein